MAHSFRKLQDPPRLRHPMNLRLRVAALSSHGLFLKLKSSPEVIGKRVPVRCSHSLYSSFSPHFAAQWNFFFCLSTKYDALQLCFHSCLNVCLLKQKWINYLYIVKTRQLSQKSKIAKKIRK